MVEGSRVPADIVERYLREQTFRAANGTMKTGSRRVHQTLIWIRKRMAELQPKKAAKKLNKNFK
ncbi:hypothetical protein DW779_09370 [Clostridium sp. AM30-24]|nr:hypothetical protein DW779_09370 [Clostridium sp. AM30-24]